MKKQKSIKYNFIMNAILTMSSFIFPLITFPYVSRVLMPAGTGKVSFASSVISYFALFAQLGIPTYGIRACAKIRDNKDELTKTVQEIFIINLAISFLAYILFVFALINIPRLSEDKNLFLIVSITIILNTLGMEWLYKALEQYTYITIRSLLCKLIALLVMFMTIHQQSDYILYGGISIFAASASNIFNFINVHRFISLKPVREYNFRRHLEAVTIFFAMSCATTIYTHLDTVMLGFMTTDKDVGYYSAAVKIKTILVSIVTSMGVVLLPRASYYIEHGQKDAFLKITQKAINFVFVVSLPMALYFILFAEEGILFLSGNAFSDAIQPMQIIMPTLFFIGLTNIMGIQILVPLGQEKIVLLSEIIGAIINLVINYLLIPHMASSGAAIGTLVAEIAVWMVQFTALYNIVGESYLQIRYKALLIALLLSVILSYWVKYLALGNFLSLLISSLLFFGVYLVALIVAKEPLVLEIKAQVLGKLKNNKS